MAQVVEEAHTREVVDKDKGDRMVLADDKHLDVVGAAHRVLVVVDSTHAGDPVLLSTLY